MQRHWSFGLGSTLLWVGLTVLLAIVKHLPAFLYIVGWALVVVGGVLLLLNLAQMSKRRKPRQRYGDPRKQGRAQTPSTGPDDHRSAERKPEAGLRIGKHALKVGGGPGQVMRGVTGAGINETVRPDGTEVVHIGHFELDYLGPRDGNTGQ